MKIKDQEQVISSLGNEFDRMHSNVSSRYVAERIFELNKNNE